MSVCVRNQDCMVPTGPLSLLYLYFSVVHFYILQLSSYFSQLPSGQLIFCQFFMI